MAGLILPVRFPFVCVCVLLMPFFHVCARMGAVCFSLCVLWSVCMFAFTLGALLLRCDASCLTCAGPSRGNCSSCSSSHRLQEGACAVSSVCTGGQSSIFSPRVGSRLCHAIKATVTHFNRTSLGFPLNWKQLVMFDGSMKADSLIC